MTEKEELEQLVKNSESLSDILRKQNKAISGAAIKVLKSKLEAYEIKYHFLNKTHRLKNNLSLDEILAKGVVYQSSKLKIKLVQNGLKEDKCEICGCPNIWHDKPLVLQLDHINGDHYDNRIENLRIVCPNCHSQTETYCNKKEKQHFYCLDCGKEIQRRSTRCLSCAAKYNKNRVYKVKIEDRPKKEELLNMILNKSFVEIGKDFGVSDNAIRKWCKNYGLPYTKKGIREYNNGRLV